jgi:pyruvate dehydrogenase E2 component (dihydrolipoamide acetyltransferase)
MNIDFKLPELGENIESGDIVNVLVHEGQTIAANDGVLELETDKAVVELPCPHAGKIVKILVKKGQTVKVGQPLLTIESEEDAEKASPSVVKPPPGATAGLPSSGSVEKPSPALADKPPVAPKQRVTPKAAQSAEESDSPIPASPAVRRLARELGVDLHTVQGSGQHGRVTAEDVQAATEGAMTNLRSVPSLPSSGLVEQPSTTLADKPPVAPTIKPVVPPGEPGQDSWGPVRRDRMSKVRQTIAAKMAQSASTIPHVTNFDDADITDLEALRAGVPDGSLGPNIRLTSMSFVLKAVATALRHHPIINASMDEENQQIVYKEYVNIGIAVDTPRGLVVPAMRNVDGMSVAEIAVALAQLAQRARAAQFAVEDLRGGTFTISNMGAVGGAYSTPIINYPEVAVLLLGRSRWMPMVREGRVEPRYMLPLSLSYDHRLVDGAAAARFLNEVIGMLQSPGRIVIG